ncbi:MAG: TIGR01777 family oxidoreductase [Solirubrobacterales bacterium]
MTKRIVIAGATGFIGRALCRELREDYEVVALSRDAKRAAETLGSRVRVLEWDGRTTSVWAAQVDGAYAVVNLAGESVGEGRWTPSKMDGIMQSRVNGANAVVDAVAEARAKPSVVIHGSAVGYYGSRGDEILSEDSPSGVTFLADVCRKGESIVARVEKQGVRYVAIRTGVVLGLHGGALPRLMAPFRFFLGGWVGNGRQWLSWISLDDEVRAIRFLLENPSLRGAFNLTSPTPATLRQFVRMVGRIVHRPAWTRMPGFAARMAMGRMADEVLLASDRAIPRRLVDAGFTFKHPGLETALRAIIQGEDHESD